jgi:two-component system phosphate regulon sensor histidine kinase PhoR
VPITQILNNELLITSIKQIQSGEWSKDELIAQEIVAAKSVLRAISAPAVGPDGSIVGTVTVLEDITAFKQLDKTKSEFVHMVAHELRSPLSAVRQQNSVILEGLAGPLHEKQQELLGRGVKKIDQLLELINGLLDIAKLEEGAHVQHRIPVDIGIVIKDIVALMEPKAREHGISLTYSCDSLKPVQADPKGVEEIFNNLISNAINYSPDGGKVTVTARGHGEYVEIQVADTGLGIPSEELPKIFDRFYRIKHPKTRQVMGTGLGLALVKGVVEAHHGTIDVTSAGGKGTTFKILLPLITQPSQQ